jgi:hypothetical protein
MNVFSHQIELSDGVQIILMAFASIKKHPNLNLIVLRTSNNSIGEEFRAVLLQIFQGLNWLGYLNITFICVII